MSWNPDRVLVYRKAWESSPVAGIAEALDTRSEESTRPARVGIWDLDASAGALPRLLDFIEERQAYFSFYSVEAEVQTGLNLPGPHVAQDWKTMTGTSMPADVAAVNISAGPIFAAAQPVLAKLPIEWLVVLVRSMVCDTASTPGSAWYNLFSTTHQQTAIISAYGLREYAAQAERPFEVAVLINCLSALIAEMVEGIEFQDETTGSIFDYCENRADIVVSLRTPTIDPENRARIPPDLLVASEQILSAIDDYTSDRTLKPARAGQRQRKVTKRPAKATATGRKALNISTPRATKPAAKTAAKAYTPSDVAFKDTLKALSKSLKSRQSRQSTRKKTRKP